MTDVRSLDLTGTNPPALSTISDMPKVGAPKPTAPKGAVSDEELKAGGMQVLPKKDAKGDKTDDKPESKGDDKPKAGDEPDGNPHGESNGEDEPKETPPWMKREITKARNKERAERELREAAERRAAAAEDKARQEAERFDRAFKALETRAGDPKTKESTTPRPTRDKFDGPEEYETALIQWTTEVAARETKARIEKADNDRRELETKQQREKAQADHHKAVADAWSKSRDAAVEKYPDWEEVATSDQVPVTPAMAVALFEVNRVKGNGGEIAYYLGKNVEEAKRIAAITNPEDLIIEMSEISARLKLTTPKKTADLPKPPTPVRSSRESVDRSSEEPAMEEYAAKRNSQLKQHRSGTY